MISLVVYTHSSYSDCLSVCIDRLKRYCPLDKFSHCFIATDKIETSYDGFNNLLYPDSYSYTHRLGEIVEQLPTPFLFFLHEDMILYDKVKETYFQECIDAIFYEEIDHIRMIKADDNYPDIAWRDSKVLKQIPLSARLLFAVQPSLWRTESFRKLILANMGKNIWSFEEVGQNFCRKNRYCCMYTYDFERDTKRGRHHYNSCTFPYIATAIIKGKWNTREYPVEMFNLFKEYKIDKEIRGTNDKTNRI